MTNGSCFVLVYLRTLQKVGYSVGDILVRRLAEVPTKRCGCLDVTKATSHFAAGGLYRVLMRQLGRVIHRLSSSLLLSTALEIRATSNRTGEETMARYPGDINFAPWLSHPRSAGIPSNRTTNAKRLAGYGSGRLLLSLVPGHIKSGDGKERKIAQMRNLANSQAGTGAMTLVQAHGCVTFNPVSGQTLSVEAKVG